MKALRIGAGSAWWGDRIEPAQWNAERGQLAQRTRIVSNQGWINPADAASAPCGGAGSSARPACASPL